MLIAILLVIIIIILTAYTIMWSVDKDMNISSGNPYNYASFKIFLNHFKLYDKIYNLKNSVDIRYDSIIKYNYDISGRKIVYIHAGIIEFEGKNMIINYFDYWRFLQWKNKYCKKPKKLRDKNLWR